MVVTPYRFVGKFEVPPPGDERKHYMFGALMLVVYHYTLTIC